MEHVRKTVRLPFNYSDYTGRRPKLVCRECHGRGTLFVYTGTSPIPETHSCGFCDGKPFTPGREGEGQLRSGNDV